MKLLRKFINWFWQTIWISQKYFYTFLVFWIGAIFLCVIIKYFFVYCNIHSKQPLIQKLKQFTKKGLVNQKQIIIFDIYISITNYMFRYILHKIFYINCICEKSMFWTFLTPCTWKRGKIQITFTFGNEKAWKLVWGKCVSSAISWQKTSKKHRTKEPPSTHMWKIHTSACYFALKARSQ